MADPYAQDAADAVSLVESFGGRTVTFRKLDTTVDDAAMPWRGTSTPRATPSVEQPVTAITVDPSSARSLGLSSTATDLVKRSQQIMIVAPGPDATYDLSTFDEALDTDGTLWRITGVESLKPAELVVLYFVGVAK